jgi:D-alanine transaminase
LERFSHSLGEIGISGVDIGEVRAKVQRSFSQANISDAKIYFHVTRGSAVRNHAAGGKLEPNFFLTVTEIPDICGEKEFGLSVSTHADWRWKRCDIKSLNLLANVLARMDAEGKGCSEAILVNEDGQITEGAGSALFAVWAGERKVQTRGLGREILASITRKVVLQLAPSVGLEVVEEALRPDDAKRADELFIAVTTKDIVGVVEFDGVKIGAGRPGKYTKILMAEFEKLVRHQ